MDAWCGGWALTCYWQSWMRLLVLLCCPQVSLTSGKVAYDEVVSASGRFVVHVHERHPSDLTSEHSVGNQCSSLLCVPTCHCCALAHWYSLGTLCWSEFFSDWVPPNGWLATMLPTDVRCVGLDSLVFRLAALVYISRPGLQCADIEAHCGHGGILTT